MIYEDRQEAGRVLSGKLGDYANREDVLVLALPRGGVPVAFEVARALHAPLDIFLVRKLGVPGQEELAMGAIASGGTVVLSDIADRLGVPPEDVQAVKEREARELQRRERAYRGDRPPPDVHGKTIILVDDGLATGSTMRAAVAALRKQGPGRIVVAVPVGAADTCRLLHGEADEVICVQAPEVFQAVGMWYRDFSQTTDEEVRDLLTQTQFL